MTRSKRNIAFLLMAIYSIVFVHNVIPHHHHYNEAVSVENVQCLGHYHHHEGLHHHSHENFSINDIVDHSVLDHHHPVEKHSVCHFEVNPVIKDSGSLNFVLSVCIVEELWVPLEEPITIAYTYYPQKLLESYNFAVPLRAPPVFS